MYDFSKKITKSKFIVINNHGIIFSSKWQKAVELIGNKCDGRVPDLAENMKYTFRIIAVNKGGFSKPSEPSDPVITKDRNGIILLNQFIHNPSML